MKKEHFRGLDTLRFFAALAVFFTHVELVKKFNGFGTHWIDPEERITKLNAFESVASKEIGWLSPIISYSSALGVVFFFVLSGFLITYLLLKEREKFGFIQIKRFYLRRIFRIWPLYYLIFLVGFFVLPYFDIFAVPEQDRFFVKNYWGNFILYALFMPNLAFSIFTTAVPNIGQSWSIGVEEQFYLVWPWLIRKSKNLVKTLALIIVTIVAIKALIILVYMVFPNPYVLVIKKFLAMSKLECMALGGFGAYLFYSKKEKFLSWMYHPWVQVIGFLIIPVLIFFTPRKLEDILHLVFSIIFLMIIINVVGNSKSWFRLHHPILEYLGRISYGFYMYHVICISVSIHLLDTYVGLHRDMTTPEHLMLYGGSFTLTVVISSISYHIFEKPFIRWKDNRAQPVRLSNN